MESFFDKYINKVKNTETIHYTGAVSAIKGLVIESIGPSSVIGEMCKIITDAGQEILAEVTGLEGKTVKLIAYGETKGISIGCKVIASGEILKAPVGYGLIGRVIDATGKPLDGKGPLKVSTYYPVQAEAPNPITRKKINSRITTGVRCIDSLFTCGKGQRLGIFAGSGVGKSSLLATIARNSSADVNVIGLIGERGREVNEFIYDDLGEEGMKRSVVVVATSDTSSICRLRAAYVTTAIAEYFRDQGKNVILMMDNMTRFAHAQREIGLSNGESPAQMGYPPSVFDLIPKLLERAGNNDKGTITGFYNVLVDSDNFNEPITDKVRGTLDGHIVLSRRLANRRHYPAIDVPASISRLANKVNGQKTLEAVNKVARWIALYDEKAEMIEGGYYAKGSNPAVDEAIDMHDAIDAFVTQQTQEHCTMEDTLDKLKALTGVEISDDEYDELPANRSKTTVELVHERKENDVTSSNLYSKDNPNEATLDALAGAAQALNNSNLTSPQQL